MLNTAQRNRQTVSTVVAHAHVRKFYLADEKKKHRKSGRPNPVIRFFNVERLLRTIDDDNLDVKAQANYDESDDGKDVVLREKGEDPNASLPPIFPSLSLPLDDNEDIDPAAVELAELLVDGPITKKPKPVSHTLQASHDEVDDGELEGDNGNYSRLSHNA